MAVQQFEVVEIDHGDTIIEQEVPAGWSDEQVQEYVNGQDWDGYLANLDRQESLANKAEVEGHVARGIRNNNPGNIRISSEKWQGLAAKQKDQSFFTFESPKMGARAMAKVLQTYNKKHSIEDVQGVVNRWAPPSENDTQGYADFVASRMGLSTTDKLDFADPDQMLSLMKAMTFMENGEAYDEEALKDGIELAGLGRPLAGAQLATAGATQGLVGGSGQDKLTTQSPRPPEELPDRRKPVEITGGNLVGTVPANVRAFTSDILGIDDGKLRNESYFDANELATIKKLVGNAITRTGSKAAPVEYSKDYPKKLDGVFMGGQISGQHFTDDFKVIKTTLGQMKYEIDDRGHLIVTDEYDFNDAGKIQSMELGAKLKLLGSSVKNHGTYGMLRTVGALFGSKEGEGAKFRVDLGPYEGPTPWQEQESK